MMLFFFDFRRLRSITTPCARVLCVFIVLMSTTSLMAGMKTWTDVEGREIKAEILDSDPDKGVLLRLDDEEKSEVWVKSERLSVRDRLFVRKWTTDRALEQGDDLEDVEVKEPEVVEPVLPERPSVQPNFDKEWPDVVDIRVGLDVETMREAEVCYIYESEHYRFISTARLQGMLLKNLAVLFETNYEFCKKVPLNFITPRLKEEDKPKLEVFFFEKNAQYQASGGAPGLGACYDSERKCVLTTLKHVGVKVVGSGYTLDSSEAHRELTNEIVHQLADPEWSELPWLWEGLASYIRAVPYRPGKMISSSMKSPIMDLVMDPPKKYNKRDQFDDRELTTEEQLELVAKELEDETIESILRFEPGYGLGDEYSCPPLEELMNYNAFRFDADLAAMNERGRVHYGTATLLVYYFLHVDGKGDGMNFKKMLYALQEGKTGKEAMELLLAGRTFAKLQDEFQSYWKTSGLDITFKKKEGS